MKLIVFGANRGVGRRAVETALAEGHEVTAAVRAPERMMLKHERLRVAQCDVADGARVSEVIAGHDVAIATLGERSRGPTTLYSTAAKTISAAMAERGVNRLVFLSNFGVLGERGRGAAQTMLLFMVKRMIRPTLDDHRRALDTLAASQVDWTAVRATPLTDGPATGAYRIAADGLPPHGSSISRGDVAGFMLAEAMRREFVRMAPAIAY
ncbi:MAG TPA: NAD(P)H-binding protein [Vitreimonas sp.]|uniref:NAD(P)-dependent oxidoreductase n=1 Tax=Vitreimonas sp. TaxID=3069702 RepID=UPI002D3A2D76|nr:NAD(P)H-binding protein [Vitreimonas sp.]HYD89687.1 NAD(P)H-binding protein [Vitreimonas sp.]